MPVSSDGSHLKLFVDSNKPILLIDRKVGKIKSDCVLVDNKLATKDATDLLIRKGHKKIAFIAGPEDIYTSIERVEGYKKSLLEAGLEVSDRLIAYGDYTIDGGLKCLKKLIEDNPGLTAVIASNAEMTIGAFIGIGDLELKVPEEVSVIGFDNVEFAKAMNPKITIVTQPIKEIAENTARIMLSHLENDDKDNKDNKDSKDSKDNKNSENGLDNNQTRYETVKLTTEIIHGNSIKDIS